MTVVQRASSTSALTLPKQSYRGPVEIYHFAPVRTAIADSADVQLADLIAPVPRPLYFMVQLEAITAYANGDGTAPIVTLKGSTTNASVAMTAAGDAAGTFKTFVGVLDLNERLLFTPTAGTGTTETGTARINVTIVDPIGWQNP